MEQNNQFKQLMYIETPESQEKMIHIFVPILSCSLQTLTQQLIFKSIWQKKFQSVDVQGRKITSPCKLVAATR